MNSQNFNETLKERAAKFILTPYDNALSNLIEARRKKRQRNKRILIAMIGLTSCILLSSIVFFYQLDKLEISNQMISENKVQQLNEKPPTYSGNALNGNSILNNEKSESTNDEINSKSRIADENLRRIDKLSIKTKEPILISKNGEDKLKKNFNTFQKPTISIVENHNSIASKSNNDKAPVVAVTNLATINEIDIAKIKSATFDSTTSIISQIAESTFVSKDDSLKNIVSLSKKVSKTEYGFQISLFNHYMLMNQAYNGAENDLIKNDFGINYNEMAKQSYSVGFMAGLTIKKFTFSLGVAYNKVDFDKLLFFESPLQNATAPGLKDLFLNSSGYKVNVIDQSLSFIEVPILIGYKMGSKKLTCNLEAGLTSQYLNQTNTYLLIMNNNMLETSTNDDAASNRFEKWQLGIVSSVSLQYNPTINFGIFVGPIAKMHAYQYYKKEFTERNAPVYLGVNSGIKFIF